MAAIVPPRLPTSSMSCPPGISFPDFLRTWNDTHVARWLTDNKCPHHVETFKNNDIRGDILLELDHDALKEMGIVSIGDRLRIVNAVKTLRNMSSQHNSSSIAHQRAFIDSFDSRPPVRTNGTDPSHSPTSSRDSRDPSPTSRTHKRLDSNRPAPLVLSPSSGRPDLPRIIREPQSGSQDGIRNPHAIRPLPLIGSNLQPTLNNFANRPSLPPLPPPPKGQPPQPPTARAGARTVHTVAGPRIRTPNQADATNYASSPLPPALTPTSNILSTPSGKSQSNSWAFGLPPDPRSGPSNMKPPLQSQSPLTSRSSSPRASKVAHNRNISFNGVPSPLVPTPPDPKLPPRPSTTGTTAQPSTHPYASVQAPASHTLQPLGQNGSALSPIVEAFQAQGSASSPGSPLPPITAFSAGRSPFNTATHNAVPSLDNLRHKLVKFIMPEEGRSYVVDVADCAGGIEVMEKVLKKADKAGSRRNDTFNVMNRVETDDGGLSVDGWSVYLEWDETNGSGVIPACHPMHF